MLNFKTFVIAALAAIVFSTSAMAEVATGQATGKRQHSAIVSPKGKSGSPTGKVAPANVQKIHPKGPLEGRSAIRFIRNTTPPAVVADLSLTGNTIVAERMVLMLLGPEPRQVLGVRMQRNLIDCPQVISLQARPKFARNITTHVGMTEALREVVAWSDEGNVYRKGCVYLVGSRSAFPPVPVPSNLRQIDKWLEFWNQPVGNRSTG